jgi:hypothetical protein
MKRLAILIALLLAGCAALEQPLQGHLESEVAPVRDCAAWFRGLDERVDASGVRDAQDTRVPGFPYLRVNRLLAALRVDASRGESAMQALAERLLALDAEARQYEILNLPEPQLRSLVGTAEAGSAAAALSRTRECAWLLQEIDLAKPDVRRVLLERASVPDDYGLSGRLLGLYALASLPFSEGVRRYREETMAAFARSPEPATGAVRYAPAQGPALSRAEVAALIADAAPNPLGIPEPTPSQLADLLALYAPSFEIVVKADYDRIGALAWPQEGGIGEPPGVDATQPVAYGHAAWTRYGGRTLLQLVYTIWFPERPALSGFDLLAGRLDGLTWRVTLAPDGEPLVYDSIHPCGCYHLFFPTARAVALPAPEANPEWLFSPQALPRVGDGERPLVRIASATHYVERVALVKGIDSVSRYSIRPYGELRSLPRPGGGRRSAFGPDGLVHGTERAERFLFWPMGIASAGAMRQWGRQATAFIGRRHFDDAELFVPRFRFDLP